MAKVHPDQRLTSISSNSTVDSRYTASTRETFTVWMKSLIFHGNGCTIFNSNGEIVFRIDNYQERNCSEVFLMDINGNVLFSIQRKKIRVLERCIKVYKWSDETGDDNRARPWIQVRKCSKILGGKIGYRVAMGSDKAAGIGYTIIGSDVGKSEFKIVDSAGQVVAEAKQKRSSTGVSFGDDVLTLMVEAQIDQLLMVALMTVHGLIHHRL